MPWFGGFGWPGWGWGYPFPYRFSPWLYRPWWGWSYYGAPWGMVTPEAELAALRAQADWLRAQLEAIEKRIEELETAK